MERDAFRDLVEHTQATEDLRNLLETEKRRWPFGHPCRGCGKYYKNHPTPDCDGWY